MNPAIGTIDKLIHFRSFAINTNDEFTICNSSFVLCHFDILPAQI
jgi:hypothetical protein